MKYLLFVLLIGGFIGCRKEEEENPHIGKMVAKLNNDLGMVKMEAFATSLSTDTLVISGAIIEDEIVRWALHFDKVPKKVGRFSFPMWEYTFPSIRLIEWLDDGCVPGRSYYLPEAKESNYIEITSYNPETGDIAGRFEFTAYNSYRNAQGVRVFDLQDSMAFTNGEFSTRIRP